MEIKNYSKFNFPLFDGGILFLLSFASIAGYFSWKRIYWLAEMPAFIFVLLLSSLGILFLAVRKFRKIHWCITDTLVLVYFLYQFIRVIIAYYPDGPTDRIWTIIATYLFYLLIRCCHPAITVDSFQRIIQGIVFIAAFQSSIGVLQRWSLLPQYDQSQKVAGLFSNPALLGCFFGIGACLCLCIILKERNRIIRFVNQFLLLFILVGLFFSGSRTAWIATLITISLILLEHFLMGKYRTTRKQALLMLTGFIIVALFAIFFLYRIHPASVDGRMLIWKIGRTMLTDNPFFGMGYGSFYHKYGNYQAAYFRLGNRPEQEISSASMNYYTFNESLNLLVEEGILGALLCLILNIHSIYLILTPNENRDKVLRLSALAIFTVLLIFGLFSYPFQDLLFNLLYALSIAQIATINSTEPSAYLTRSARHMFIPIVVLVVTGSLSVMKLRAIHTWKTAKEKILLSEGESLAGYHQAYTHLATNGSFLFNYGSELAELKQFPQAEEILERAARYGNSVELHLRLGKVYQDIGNIQASEDALLRAAAMNPKLFLPLKELMLFYKETGQASRSREIARRILAKPVKIPSETIQDIKKLAETYN